MIPNHIIVRFGELTTKGKNRKNFTRKLLNNTKEILKDFDKLTYQLTYDHLYIMLKSIPSHYVIRLMQISKRSKKSLPISLIMMKA